jgi:hypothetical protein
MEAIDRLLGAGQGPQAPRPLPPRSRAGPSQGGASHLTPGSSRVFMAATPDSPARGLSARDDDDAHHKPTVMGTCSICWERPVQAVILDCGHATCCMQCAGALRTCPSSRRRVCRRVCTRVALAPADRSVALTGVGVCVVFGVGWGHRRLSNLPP